MGMFGERRKSSLPEAYTGVNRPPTLADMPNKNALAAANTIGKLFQSNTGSSVNTEQMSLSRSSSFASTSRKYQTPRRAALSLLLNVSHQQPQHKHSKKTLGSVSAGGDGDSDSKAPSRRNSILSGGSANTKSNRNNSINSRTSSVLQPPAASHASPLGSSSPLHSLTSNSSYNFSKDHQKIKVSKQRQSLSSLTSDNTRQNEIATRPKMVKKTVPTAYGLKTIEVPADLETPSASRTSSLLGKRHTYIPKQSSFTVSSINEKRKLKQKLKDKENRHQQHGCSVDDLDLKHHRDVHEGDNLNHSFAAFPSSGNNSLLLPPSLHQAGHNKARKRVSFTEESPDHSVVSNLIIELPYEEEAEAEAKAELSAASHSKSTPLTSPLKSALHHHDTPSKIIPEPAPQPIFEETSEPQQVDVPAPETNTVPANAAEEEEVTLTDNKEHPSFKDLSSDNIPQKDVVTDKKPEIETNFNDSFIPSSSATATDSKLDLVNEVPSAQANGSTAETSTQTTPETDGEANTSAVGTASETAAAASTGVATPHAGDAKATSIDSEQPQPTSSSSTPPSDLPKSTPTDVNIPALSVPTPPPIKQSSEIAEKLNQAQQIKPKKDVSINHTNSIKKMPSPSAAINRTKSNSNNNGAATAINNVPYKSPARNRSKRNSTPVKIPLAHALEQSDTLSAFNSAKAKSKHQQNRQSLPVTHSQSIKFAGGTPSTAGQRQASSNIKRSQSIMGNRSFRNAGPEPAPPPRANSAMGNRSFRNSAVPQQQQTHTQTHASPVDLAQARTPKPRPRSQMGFKSLRNDQPAHEHKKPQASLKPELQSKSSFEKVRPTENNLAFKRLSMRDHTASPTPPNGNAAPAGLGFNHALSPQSTASGGGANGGGRGFGLFKSRFEDSDDEDDYGGPGAGHKFAVRSLRQSNAPSNATQAPPQRYQPEPQPKKFGFARLHNSGNGSVPATPQRNSTGRYDETDALKTPSSSINSEKLFEKHLKESKQHFLFNQFDGQSSGRKSKKHQQHQGLVGPSDLDAYQQLEEEPKKKKLGRLRKLFGSK